MARKVTPVHTRVVVAVAKAVEEIDGGKRVKVTSLCGRLGITPKTFYKWAARYRAEGLAGLEERSRRPKRSPGRLDAAVEDAIVEWRKRLDDEGLDAGAATVRWHLERGGVSPLPSVATVWRCLVRRGFVVPEPAKRPKCSLCRFEAPAPNDWWQIDATHWVLAGGEPMEVINVLDDHSRLCAASVAVPVATTEHAWEAFSAGVERYGLPCGCLSDNGLIFSGRLHGYEVFFEAQLRAAGVRPITSRPYHPQTCGKVERFQQTLKKWLRAHRPARTAAELQAQLDTFRDYYNQQRPHRALAGQTPWERWSQASPAAAPTAAIDAPELRRAFVVNRNGAVVGSTWSIGLGIEYAGRPATVVTRGAHVTVFVDGRLTRDLDIDTGRYYQPTGKPRGRRPRPPK
jgi:transposase InsO family protein